MGDSGELADGLVFLIAQQVVELRIDFLQVIGDFGDVLFQSHLCHDAADAGEHGGVELPPGWVNFRCLMMRPFGCRITPAWNGPFLQFLPYLATSSADSLVSFIQRPLSAMALPAACAPLLADEMVCTALAVNALESKPSSLSQRSMVPASPRKTMPCSSWMMVTLCVSSGLLFPVLASASPSPPSNGMSSLESSSIMVIPFKSTWQQYMTGRRVDALGSGGGQV